MLALMVLVFPLTSVSSGFVTVTLFALAYFLKADYGIRGVGFILLVHFLRNVKIVQAFAGSSIFTNNALAVLIAFGLINMYNGERGFIDSKLKKYLYYVAYPVHILIIWIIKAHMLGW